ncbi:MAG: hypothetical protein LRZ85_00285 [Alphaproteobacteria bacterium]|nr:hypothetical protein [Alphaproteobacteria bacterium]MCD8520475.1 hypothetical protein [Alphaproteobacteria bacterium]MCD8571189.1 hypothetical protein [Alphaproteobacteria bacterium]
MSIWIFLWILVSAALIYFSAWTTLMLLRQKKAWQSFAAAHNLRFQSASPFTPPKMSGSYKGYEIALFPSEHQTADARGARKLMAIELFVKSKIPCNGALGTGGMVQVIQELSFPDEVRPDEKWWDPAYIIKTENRTILEAYLTPERLKALVKLGRVKNLWLIYIFMGENTILRIDTPDPLDSTSKIEKILGMMLETTKILELENGEAGRISRAEKDKKKTPAPLKTEDSDVTGLELEDDDS